MKLAIVLSSGRSNKKALSRQVDQILELKIEGVDRIIVVVSIDDYSYDPIDNPEFNREGVVVSYSRIKQDKRTFACTYLNGYRKALSEGAGIVVEMDAGGSHKIDEIKNIVRPIVDGYDCSFSSRYKGGQYVKSFPIQRKLISWVGTSLTGFLVKGKRPSDLTSGFEAFSSKFLTKLFKYFPDNDSWVSTKTAGHLFQSEIRAYTCNLGAEFEEVPILYGIENKGKKLPLWYLVRALLGYFGLVGSTRRLRERIALELESTK